MGYNIGLQLNGWLARTDEFNSTPRSIGDLAETIGISATTLSAHKSGRLPCGRRNLKRIAQGLGLSVDQFLEGPEIESGKSQDELYECKATKLKELVCEGCKVPRRHCATQCRLARYFRLCYEVTNGIIDMDEAMRQASTLTDDCVRDANVRHDRETGFEE